MLRVQIPWQLSFRDWLTRPCSHARPTTMPPSDIWLPICHMLRGKEKMYRYSEVIVPVCFADNTFILKKWINELLLYVPVIMHWPMKGKSFLKDAASVHVHKIEVPCLSDLGPWRSQALEWVQVASWLSPETHPESHYMPFYPSSLTASSLKMPCPPPPSFLISFPPHSFVLALTLAVLKAGVWDGGAGSITVE